MFCFKASIYFWGEIITSGDSIAYQIFWIVLSNKGNDLVRIIRNNSAKNMWAAFLAAKELHE